MLWELWPRERCGLRWETLQWRALWADKKEENCPGFTEPCTQSGREEDKEKAIMPGQGTLLIMPGQGTLLIMPGQGILLIMPVQGTLLIMPGQSILLIMPGQDTLLIMPGQVILLRPRD